METAPANSLYASIFKSGCSRIFTTLNPIVDLGPCSDILRSVEQLRLSREFIRFSLCRYDLLKRRTELYSNLIWWQIHSRDEQKDRAIPYVLSLTGRLRSGIGIDWTIEVVVV